MKKTLAMLMLLALLCAAALAEDAAFELGHMEDTTYVNDDLGIAFAATGFSGMEQSYAGEALGGRAASRRRIPSRRSPPSPG